MARAKLDFSEYEKDEYEKYLAQVRGTPDIALDMLNNDVYYDDRDRCLHIDVTDYFEWPEMEQLSAELYGPKAVAEEETDPEYQREKAEELSEVLGRFRRTFKVEASDSALDPESETMMVNVLSGASITVPLGEGILDFCYTDLREKMEKTMSFFALFSEEMLDAASGEIPSLQDEESVQELRRVFNINENDPRPEREPEKIRNDKENMLHIFERYTDTMMWLDDLAYSTLYTAAFPPAIHRRSISAMRYYINYLSLLQSELLELLEFCFDEDYEPETLSLLCPSQRYYVWCRIKERSPNYVRHERFDPVSDKMSGTRMPFGMPMEELTSHCSTDVELTDAQREFAKRNGLDPNYLYVVYRFPRFLRTSYTVSTLRDMLYLEFTKMLEQGVRIRKCKRCGRYFILKGKYPTEYCSRMDEVGTRTCQQLAAQENYRAKVRGNEGENAWGAFQRYYKRYFARVKVGTIKEPAFKKWQYEAVVKRDECADGRLALADYLQWLEGSFPNRKKRE